jgi:hypothetical protein
MTGDKCTRPPEGWYCTRRPDHDGPCAALPVVNIERPDDTAFSFPVSRKEAEQAKIWMEKHDQEKHAKALREGSGGKKFRYAGAIGGAYTWEFTSTSIGTVTNIRCSCGEKLDVTNYDDW